MPTPANLYGPPEAETRTAKTEREKMDGPKKAPDKLVSRYWREVKRYDRAAETWLNDADSIVDTYLKEGKEKANDSRTFALLWSNVQTLQPAIYSRLPVIQCSRRWKDKDPVGKVAAELQERATNTTLELYGAHSTFKLVRDDRLLAGRGQAWVRHEASLEKYATDEKDADDQPVMGERLKGRKVCIDYVHYRDFGHNVAPVWADVWLVWRCVYKTREDVADMVAEGRWNKDIASKLAYTHKPPASLSDGSQPNSDDQQEDCAKIYEFWDKRRGLVSWASEGLADFLESGDPPLDFREFFPCPEALYSTKTSKRLIPTPDYRYYVDQAKEINDLTAKIANLCEWLKLKAFVPQGPSSEGAGAIMAMLNAIQDACLKDQSIFVPVESWAGFSEKGGGKLIEWLPIREVAETLKAAIEARNQLISDVYQLTGISDILRGETDPNETATAQSLKAQTGSRRAKETRDDMARWCRDIGALVAEVIAENYEPEAIAELTGYKYQPQSAPAVEMAGLGGLPGLPPAQPMPPLAVPAQPGVSPDSPPGMMRSPLPVPEQAAAPIPQAAGPTGYSSPAPQPPGSAVPPGGPAPNAEADSADNLVFDDRHIELLRNDKLRSFRIDVETDSTAQPDEDAEKQRRIEFVDAFGSILERGAALAQNAPVLMPLIGEVLKFTARGFRAGRQLEDVIDRTMDQVAAQAANPQPDPEAQKAEAEMAAKQQKAQLEAEIAQQKLALEQQKAEAQAALEQQKMQFQMQLEQQKAQLEGQIAQMKAESEAAMAQQQMANDAAGAEQERMIAAQSAEQDRQLARENADADREMAARNADQDRALAAKNADADRKVAAKSKGGK